MNRKNKAVKTTVCFLLSLLVIASAVLATKSAFGILEQKRDNAVYFSDCLSPDYEPEKSEAVSEEIKTLIEKALTYSAMKDDLTLFENSPYVMSEIETIRTDTERNIENTIYFTEEKIKTDSLDSETIENGFAVLSDSEKDGAAVHINGKLQYARTDADRIEEYFEKEFERRSEETKLNLSTAYREAKEYLDGLEAVEYCVTVKNHEVKTDAFDSAKTAKDSLAFLVVLSDDGTVTVKQSDALPGIQTDFIKETAKKFTGPLDLHIVFTGSMLFNESLKKVPALHDECRSLVVSLLLKAILFSLAAIVSTVIFVILFPVGNRKKSTTVLSCFFAAVSAAVIVLSVCLLSDSVKLFMDPTIGTSWLTVDSNSIVTKACLRVCVSAAALMGLAASFKTAVLSRKHSVSDKEDKSI